MYIYIYTYIYIYIYIYIYLYIYISIILILNTTYTPGHHHNGFMTVGALRHTHVLSTIHGCAQVNQLPRSHYGDYQLPTFFCQIYIFTYILYIMYMYIYYNSIYFISKVLDLVYRCLGQILCRRRPVLAYSS